MNPTHTLQDCREIATDHPLWNHPFLGRCRAGTLTYAEVQVLAVQMYQFSQAFNRILASIMSCCPDEQAQLVILENLIDELGHGDINLTHPELFRRFTRALGIDDETLAMLPTHPETQEMIETYLDLPRQFGYLAALGAVCFASEGIVNSLYSQLQTAIVGTSSFSQEALSFFTVHIDLDDDHAAHLESLIEPRVQTAEDIIRLHHAIRKAMDARIHFFNGIQRQAAQVAPELQCVVEC